MEEAQDGQADGQATSGQHDLFPLTWRIRPTIPDKESKRRTEGKHSDLWRFFDLFTLSNYRSEALIHRLQQRADDPRVLPGCVVVDSKPSSLEEEQDDKDEPTTILVECVSRNFVAQLGRTPHTEFTPLGRMSHLGLGSNLGLPPGLETHFRTQRERYAPRRVAYSPPPNGRRTAKATRTTTNRRSTRPSTNPSGTLLPKKRRTRYVPTHNPDGTRKSCYACGTLHTPMWRRGPHGLSTLCNACGSRWKIGRLVVPEHPVPPRQDQLDAELQAQRTQQQTLQLSEAEQHVSGPTGSSGSGEPDALAGDKAGDQPQGASGGGATKDQAPAMQPIESVAPSSPTTVAPAQTQHQEVPRDPSVRMDSSSPLTRPPSPI